MLSTDPFVIVDSCAPCDRCFLDQSHFRFGGVAIKQHESFGNRSLKEFAEGSLGSPKVEQLFTIYQLLPNVFWVDPSWIGHVGTVIGGSHDVFTSKQLVYVASAMVATLFASFVGLLIPASPASTTPSPPFSLRPPPTTWCRPWRKRLPLC